MKDIKGYEGLYAITEDGEVWSYRSNKYLKQQPARNYLSIELHKDNNRKNYFIHRLVAETYIPNPHNLPEVNHIDENKYNNCVDNLEWVSHKDNMNYGTQKERASTKCKKRIRCIETDTVYNSTKEAAEALDIKAPNITACLKGRQKTSGKYHWEYVEE